MGRKLFKMTGLMLMLFILVMGTGCAKKVNVKTTDSESSVEDSTKTTEEEANLTVEETEVKEEDSNGSEEEALDQSQEGAATDQEAVVLEGGIMDVYAQFGVKAGTCLSDAMIAESKYTDIIKENFNQITLENFTKPDYILNKDKSIESGELTVEFNKNTTDLLTWAKENGMKVRGHVLVWYSQTPDWIFYEDFDKTKGLVDRDTLLARMESYIKQVFEQIEALGYTDMFYAYDVVNEAIMEDGSYRDCLWKQIIGDDYIWHAFQFADQYAPESIKLYYNDYNEQFKTSHVVKLAKSLVDEDGRTLIDGIGCQGHLYTKDSISSYITTLKAFSALGLEVQITELDVSLGTWQNILEATEENLMAQGQYYYELINRIMEENAAGNTKVTGITFWGFADQLSWRRDRSPLLFDGNLVPKYSYFGAKLDRVNAGY
ncbi:MAG: putative secreted protein [Herbinix sp.]|jgi:endo-1,4-beta-xylanase|nr:putative secreted protein [Herbinix sp.]